MDVQEILKDYVCLSSLFSYCPETSKWLFWDGSKMKTDVGEVKIFTGVVQQSDKGITPHAVREVVGTLERTPETCKALSEFDQHPRLFACEQLTVDLKTSEGLRPKRQWLLTRSSPVVPEQSFPTPTWDAFFAWINNHDEARIEAMYRLLGYFLTGDTREQQVYFLYGPGCNGKTVLLELVKHLMGDYAVSVSPLLLVKDQHGSRHPTELMTLCGARLGIMSELSPGARMDVAKMKYLTGGDTICARSMRQDEVNFNNTCKLIAAVNDLPEIEIGAGHAEKRRIVIIPCANIVPEEDIDRDLLNKLKAEAPGILAKIIGGSARYLEGGIQWTQDILDATAEMWDDNNDLEEFVGRETVSGLDLRACKSEFYQRYSSYRFNSGMDKLTPNAVTRAMKKLGYSELSSNSKRYWKNLSLKSLAE